MRELGNHRGALLAVEVAEPLNVVEDKPSEGDEHEEDEGDGNKEDRGAIKEGVLHIYHSSAPTANPISTGTTDSSIRG
ncbi:hypothetical protein EGR_07417 [Echinococcus granulosus]|uniref:Uncharacterized protein n=1 Tax=Echinococcus granulosus TaxID=6210 RepID=W6UI32_ECHGR|nr:hypothetical protein EGR_07417 [Echinococcus granulosus]EUB57757.1 hypothetical protein EGR_07417 [Echinococcus granulosus]